MRVQAIHLPLAILAECRKEACRHYPRETGGTFMGHVYEDIIYVDGFIGAGPRAKRQRYSFTPDQNWQLDQIAAHYERSGRRSTYVGDWHTHPGARSGQLSKKDCGVLKRIIATPDARCAQPVMAILWGGPGEWALAAWSGTLMRRRFRLPGTFIEPFELRQCVVA